MSPAPAPHRPGAHLLDAGDLDAGAVVELLRLAEVFEEVNTRAIPKVPALTGRTVASMFFEDSTRTRLSFETAARRLSADVTTFSAGTSSTKKGESLRDTVETLAAMGVHAMVVRHRSSGVPATIARWVGDAISVVNAGDGWHQHPTQALLDAATLCRALGLAPAPGAFAGLRVAIVGDVKHSRVARSGVQVFTTLGAGVRLVAPSTLLPPSLAGWPVEVSHDLDAVLGDVDVVYLLRMQLERQEQALVPTLREYTARYGLTLERARRLRPGAVVMHPGPMNRGVEIGPEVPDLACSVITSQVARGVAVRMAVLYRLLGSGVPLAGAAGAVPTVRDLVGV